MLVTGRQVTAQQNTAPQENTLKTASTAPSEHAKTLDSATAPRSITVLLTRATASRLSCSPQGPCSQEGPCWQWCRCQEVSHERISSITRYRIQQTSPYVENQQQPSQRSCTATVAAHLQLYQTHLTHMFHMITASSAPSRATLPIVAGAMLATTPTRTRSSRPTRTGHR